MSRIAAWLFPDPPRQFRGRRALKVLLRAAHVLCAGLLVGCYLFDAETAQRITWLVSAIVSGLILLALDLHESAAFLLQLRGLVVLVKLGVLATLPLYGAGAPWVLGALVVLSVLSSHASSKVRYRVLVGSGRIKGAETSG